MSFVKSALFLYNLFCALIGIFIMMMGGGLLSAVNSDKKAPIHYDMHSPVVAIIVFGAIVCGIAFVGCFAVLNKSECMSNIYICIMLLLIVIQIAFTSFIYFDSHDSVQFIVDKYTEMFKKRENEEYRIIINTVQEELNCCGLNSFLDYLPHAPPHSCGFFNMVGCREEILKTIYKSFNIVIWTSVAVAGIEIVGLILAWLLLNSFNSNNRVAGYNRLYANL